MAQYKVLQDIEAEDKLLGPLSLRQFIYAVITIVFCFVAFRIFMTPVWFVGFVLLPFILFFGLLAAPLGGQQSSEIWLLAKIRFFLKPRRRIWDQAGLQELVTITVPKTIERQLTKGYSQEEVKSRLKVLATTLDTRGWAVKNATSNPYSLPGTSSDRLLDINTSQAAPAVFVEPAVDMLDPQANPRAQVMDQMMNKSAEQHRQQVIQGMRQAPPSPEPAPSTLSMVDESALLDRLHKTQSGSALSTSHLKTLQPGGSNHKNTDVRHSTKPVTPPRDPAILNLVENSEDLSVETIARQANRIRDQKPDDEVIISLH